MIIYLAGGMKSDWQDRVIDHPEFIEASNAALARIRLGHG